MSLLEECFRPLDVGRHRERLGGHLDGSNRDLHKLGLRNSGKVDRSDG
jgi:hypothetical protein